jgi:hypothetical protein
MAQSGYTPILIYGSTTATNAPIAGNLITGSNGIELAINAADGKLFYKDTGGVVQTLATKNAAAGTFSSVTITGGTITGVSISSLSADLAVTDGGTGASTASGARTNLSAAQSGANSDITSLTGLTTALSVAQGGTGVTTSTGTGSVVLSASPTFTGTPAAPTASGGTNTTQVATTAFVQSALSTAAAALYPVGSIYINATNSTNPATLLGFGTWTAFGAGRVPVGFDAGNALFDTAEETGGSADAITVSHTHTATSTDSGHTHSVVQEGGRNTSSSYQNGPNPTFRGEVNTTLTTASGTANITTTVASTGSSGTNANYQPYITVYMWKRTA